jgi:hypothetical protein
MFVNRGDPEMPTIALELAFAACSIALTLLFYVALATVAQYRTAHRCKKVAEFGRKVNGSRSENWDRVVEVPIAKRFRRRPLAQQLEYQFASRRRG